MTDRPSTPSVALPVPLRPALLVLRLGLGVFLLLWSVDKIVAPEATARIFGHFYGIGLAEGLAPLVGVAEALLSLALLAGLWRTWTYGIALALHTVSTLSTWRQLLSPFGDNHLFIAALPVLAAFVALFLLREQDTLASVDAARRRPAAPPRA